MKTAGDHQMQHHPEIACKANGDAFPDPAEFAYGLPLEGLDRGLHGTQQKGAGHACMLEPLAQNAGLERAEIGGNVGQLRHSYQLSAPVPREGRRKRSPVFSARIHRCRCHGFAGYGKTPGVESFVSGRDFSRAAKTAKSMRASAP